MNIDQLINQAYNVYEEDYLLQNTDIEDLKNNFQQFKNDSSSSESKELAKSLFDKSSFTVFQETPDYLILLREPSNNSKNTLVKIAKYSKQKDNLDFSSNLNKDAIYRYFLFHSSNKFSDAFISTTIQNFDISSAELKKYSKINKSLEKMINKKNDKDIYLIQVIEAFSDVMLLTDFLKDEKNAKLVLFHILYVMHHYKSKFPNLTFNINSLDSFVLKKTSDSDSIIEIDTLKFKLPNIDYKLQINDFSNIDMEKNDNDVDLILNLFDKLLPDSNKLIGMSLNDILVKDAFFSEYLDTKPNTNDQDGGDDDDEMNDDDDEMNEDDDEMNEDDDEMNDNEDDDNEDDDDEKDDDENKEKDNEEEVDDTPTDELPDLDSDSEDKNEEEKEENEEEKEENEVEEVKKNKKTSKKMKGKGKVSEDDSDIFVKITKKDVQGRRKLHTGYSELDIEDGNSSSLVSLSISDSEGGAKSKNENKKSSKKQTKKETPKKNSMASLFGNPGVRPTNDPYSNLLNGQNGQMSSIALQNMKENEYSVDSPVSDEINNENFARNNMELFEKQKLEAEPYQVNEQHAKPFNMKNNSIRNLLNANSQAQINRGINLQGNEQMGMQQPGMPQMDMSQMGMQQPGMPQIDMSQLQGAMPQPGMPQPGMPQIDMSQLQGAMPQMGMPQPGMPQIDMSQLQGAMPQMGMQQNMLGEAPQMNDVLAKYGEGYNGPIDLLGGGEKKKN